MTTEEFNAYMTWLDARKDQIIDSYWNSDSISRGECVAAVDLYSASYKVAFFTQNGKKPPIIKFKGLILDPSERKKAWWR
jgi:hypothetical protein